MTVKLVIILVECQVIVSGNVKIYNNVYMGNNSSIREKITINSSTTIGMNGAVVKHIIEPGTYVGTPGSKD